MFAISPQKKGGGEECLLLVLKRRKEWVLCLPLAYITFIARVVSYLKFLLLLLNKLSFSDTTVIEGGRERKHS